MGKIVVLISSKGGSGKSTVAVGLSAAFSLSGKRVLLVDADEGARCIDTMLGINGETVFDINDVICGNATLEEVGLNVASLPLVTVIPSPFENVPLDFERLTEIAKTESENYDYVIIDTKGQLPAARLSLLPHNATFVSVVTDEPVALKNAGILASGLKECGIKCRLIINRFKAKGQNGKINNIDEMIDICNARLLGVVPEDKVIRLYSGKPIVFGLAAKAIHRIAARLEGNTVELPRIKDIIK